MAWFKSLFGGGADQKEPRQETPQSDTETLKQYELEINSLWDAVEAANIEKLKSFLESGHDPNARDQKFGGTPLHFLARPWTRPWTDSTRPELETEFEREISLNRRSISDLLIMHGADVNLLNDPSQADSWPGADYPITLAARLNNSVGSVLKHSTLTIPTSVTPNLIRSFAQKKLILDEWGTREDQLNWIEHIGIITNGQISIFDSLLNAGANINSIGWGERTPLMSAVDDCNSPLVEYLLKRGADTTIIGNGDTAMSMAIELFYSESDPSIVKLLIDVGNVDPNDEVKDGMNAFQLAERWERTKVIEMLNNYR